MMSPLSRSPCCLVVLSLFYASTLYAANSASYEDETTSNLRFRIAGYLPDYRLDAINLNATIELLDDLYLFSLAPHAQLGSRMFSVCCWNAGQYTKARQAVSHILQTAGGKKVNIWVTIGGGGRSDSFLDDPNTMIRALKELTAKEALQGVDFDCESIRSQAEFTKYQALIVKAAAVLHQSNVLVSVALHAGQTLSSKVYAAVDRINLMAYDMSSAEASYHADFKIGRQAVNILTQSGCPTKKIFLGMPAYGRHKRMASDVKTFAELVDGALERGTPIQNLYKLNEIDEYQIDSPDIVADKVRQAQMLGLGGVFFWELGQDKQLVSIAPAGILLTAAANALERSIVRNKTRNGRHPTTIEEEL